ncbi:interleukin-31 receptor subunit alpha-like isoform X2 [Sparus aurata]|uniref:interleukin-31 receptor subunit alpha-like isoform X2 n=1 Tax=Sparus aurata TaxID=8175 RepID=UPI0011C124A2|nr:interleukin-31 receptor subunit alpha-like isoform X2 [Sparus aurata]
MYPLLFLLVLGVTPSACKEGSTNTCDVVPKDLYIEAGSSIEIVCLTSCVRGKVYWTLDNKSVDGSRYNTNSTHAVLSLRNFTLPRATLQCHSNDTHQVLGGTTIKTYLKPSNLSCFLHHENMENSTPDQFTCSWEHQVDPSLTINYTVLWTKSDSSESGEICSSTEKTCKNTYKSSNTYFSGSYSATVKAQSAVWEATSDPFEFTPSDIIKIPHPKWSSVTLSSDQLLVKWKIWPYASNYKYHCQVKYSKMINEGTPKWEIIEIEILNENSARWYMTTERLESCSNYTVAVRCNLNKGAWSDWSPEKTVLTKLKKSDYEPRLWRKVEVEKNGDRRVHTMWTEIPPTCQDTFNFTIKQTPYKENTTGVNYMATLCDSSISDVNEDAHTITLEVFHKDSLFAEDSVYVPAVGESLPEVTGIQTNSTPEGVIRLSWKAPAQPVSGFMIDYTHDGKQYYWKETKDTHASLDGLLDKTPYNITVTPLFDDKTGHGAQVLDICSREGDPGNVNISVVPGHQSAYVSWDVRPQDVCSEEVVSFTIFYSTEQGPELNVTANSKSHHTLQDLTPDTQYTVYVKATAHTRTTNSEVKSFKTTRFDPHFNRTLIIRGTLLIFLVLTVGLCCAVRWKRFKDQLVPDPGRSSVALLASESQNTAPCTFEPSESICSSIYIEEAQTVSTFLPDTGCNENPASDQTRGYDDPAIAPATDRQTEDPVEPVETQPPSSPGELSHLLSSESGLSSPYRSQSPQETPAPKTSKPCKRVPVKQPEKMPPLSVYVSLDMFEQGQGR